jgi:uncharacterized DUF497 family protein
LGSEILEFEWDPDKNESNELKHGISFRVAASLLQNHNPKILRSRETAPGELRHLAVGESDSDMIAVVYTKRGDVFRIISARKASRSERREYSQSKSAS